MFTYAKRSTTVRPKIFAGTAVQFLPPGHYRSIPQGVGLPVPNKRSKPSQSREKPENIGTSGVTHEPLMEPENAPTLEPTSRL
jgi:hypothetical protein